MEEAKPIFDRQSDVSVTFLSRELFFQALQEYMQTMKPYLRSRAAGSERTRAPSPTSPDRKRVFPTFANLHFNPLGSISAPKSGTKKEFSVILL